MKIAIILGTRPEIIKMSPVVRACQKYDEQFFILHTGQHYSKELDGQMFEDLELPEPAYNLRVGGQPFRMQVGLMTREICRILEREKPDLVLVQGDTISVLAGALAANKLGIPIGHHEAGLRSHDITMPEETNRIITDHISNYLFVPTTDALKNLRDEGRDTEKIFHTGNTIVDAVYQNLEIAEKKRNVHDTLGLVRGQYLLASAHRAENVDVPERLKGIIAGLDLVQRAVGVPIIFSLHPRTKNRIKEFGITVPDTITLIEPVGFLEFLLLEKHARMILTDSGGLQEEACILKVPCVTLRDNTERPETVTHQANIVAGTKPEGIYNAAMKMLESDLSKNLTQNPFGDGTAGEKIVAILRERLNTSEV